MFKSYHKEIINILGKNIQLNHQFVEQIDQFFNLVYISASVVSARRTWNSNKETIDRNFEKDIVRLLKEKHDLMLTKISICWKHYFTRDSLWK